MTSAAGGIEKKPKRIKTSEPNLWLVGQVYYYRKGDFEEALGQFKSEKLAIEYKRLFEIKRDSIGVQAYKFKVKDIWPDYLEYRRQQRDGEIEGREQISARTFEEIQHKWEKHLRAFWAPKKLSEIDDPLWQKYCDHVGRGDLTNHRKVFGSFLRWCKIKGYTRFVPEMVVPKVKRRKLKILKPAQMEAVIEHAGGSLLLFIALYLKMGVRRGEQIQLRWSDVDFEREVLQIRPETSRTRKGRSMGINDFVLELLRQRKADQDAAGLRTPWVFPKRGRPDEHMTESGNQTAWETMLRHAELDGLGITPHGLRATFEYYANKRADFTDTQRAKMAGASIEIQRKHYVEFEAEDVLGLEEVVQFPGLEELVRRKLQRGEEDGKNRGKTGPVRKRAISKNGG